MSNLIAAFLGAIAAGLIQIGLKWWDRVKLVESTKVAICAEVDALCRLIRVQGYLEGFKKLQDNIAKGIWDGRTYVIDIRSNYFSIYENLSHNIGLLRPTEVAKIVAFYSYCRSVIDATRPDGAATNTDDLSHKAENVRGIVLVLEALLFLADEIRKFPKNPLPLALRDTAVEEIPE